MDSRRFDDLTRALGTPGSRRGFLKGLLGAGLAAAGLGRLAGAPVDAQVSQAQCGNVSCRNNPAKCAAGCVCCAYANGSARCRPPGQCSPGETVCPPGKFADSALGCVDCLSGANCPGPTDGNPCLVAACSQGKCGIQPGNAGAACGQPACAGGAVTNYVCDQSGTCVGASPVSCAPYLCAGDGISCRKTCANDGECVGTAFCQGGECLGDLALGAPCTGNNQCLSGFCTNGVCCTVAACGTCQACNAAGSCAPATGGPCTPSDACFAGVCVDGGVCFPTGAPRDCPPIECQQGLCQSGACQYRPVEGEPICGTGDECSSKVCRGGSCQSVPTNELQSCSGGTVCNPKFCQSGLCVSMPDRANNSDCPGGICFGGSCCQGATREEEICGYQFGTCCQTKPCCGGDCCFECFNEPSTTGGPDTQICCPQGSLCPPNDPDASQCCYSTDSCLQTSFGHQCIDSERDCGGVVCDGDCCAGECCGDGAYCSAEGCVPIPMAGCTSDAQCPGELTCVGIIEDIGPDGVFVATPGSCCPFYRACPSLDYQGPGSGVSFDYCVSYGFRCDSQGATCDNAYYVACGNCVNCSPRGSRTRL